jgi:hypothetical protein
MSFTATKWSTAEDKERFLSRLKKFVTNGFSEKQFTEKLYQRLCLMFRHLSHKDKTGFWDVWFSSPGKQLRWVGSILAYIPAGDPAWTWSDVEMAFRSWLIEREDIILRVQQAAARSVRLAALAEYRRLREVLHPTTLAFPAKCTVCDNVVQGAGDLLYTDDGAPRCPTCGSDELEGAALTVRR